VYPNPVADKLFISMAEMSNKDIRTDIVDLRGNIVIQRYLLKNTSLNIIDVSMLPSGTYFLHLYEGNSLIQSNPVMHF